MTTPSGPLFLLAMDHRASLVKTVYDGDDDQARLEAGKMLVFDGLQAAVERGADPAATGVLVDEKYGAAVIAAAHPAGVRLAVPVEASGHEWFTLEFPGVQDRTWVEHVEAADPELVKVLVRDNPGFDAEKRAAQQRDLAVVSRGCAEMGRPFLLELLVPAMDQEKGDDYDRDTRPGLTVTVVTELQDAGVEPAIWKIEGLETADAAREVVAACQRDGREHVRCIVLGRDAPQEKLDHWLSVAAGIPGFMGFAIGRSIWEEPLEQHLAGTLTRDEAVTEIATRYLHFVAAYRAAS